MSKSALTAQFRPSLRFCCLRSYAGPLSVERQQKRKLYSPRDGTGGGPYVVEAAYSLG